MKLPVGKSGKGEGLTLKAFATAVRRYRLTCALVVGVVLALGGTLIVLLPHDFVSSTRLMVSIQGSTTAAAYQNEDVATRRIRSYIPLLTSGVVTQSVIDKLGLPMTSDELAAKINATNVPPKTSLIDIEITDESPERAREIANTLAAQFIAYAASVETPTGEDDSKVKTTVVSAATEGRQSRSAPVLLGALTALAALVLAGVAVWIRAARERSPVSAQPDAAGEEASSSPVQTIEATDPGSAG